MRILIVEDNDETRLELVNSLKKEGYEVYSVDSGDQALKAIKADKYDFVLSDVNMPGIGGLELAEKLFGDPPMILYTSGKEITGLRNLAERCGVVMFITNATIPNLLQRAIERFSCAVQDNTNLANSR